MALKDILAMDGVHSKKIGVSEERINAVMPTIRSYIAYWREYPDMFVDFLQQGDDPDKPRGLKFYFYQRVFLRTCMRYKYVYMTFPRAWRRAKEKIFFRGKLL